MPDEISSLRVVCSGGLNSNENSLELSETSPGSATRLLNYEPSLYGGYRRINGFEEFDKNHSEVGAGSAEGKILGIAIYKDPFGANKIIAARKQTGSATYKFYYWSTGIGWVAYSTGITHNTTFSGRTVNRIRHKTFNFGNGNQIIFVDGVNPAVLFDGTSWTEIKSTKNGSNFANAGGAMVLDAPTIVDVFENHVFLGSDPNYSSILSHSAPNKAYDFTAASGAGQITSGIEVVQIKPFRENLFVFGENDIKKVSVQGTDFVLNNVTNNVGCIARDSVLEIGGDLIFLAPDGIRPVAGTSRIGDVELETISKDIQQKLSDLPLKYDMDALCGVVIRKKSQIRYFLDTDETLVSTSYGILGGLTLAKDTIKWEFGEIQGIRASCCVSGYINKDEYVLHGDYNGRVYRQERGPSFDDEPILSVYSTPYLDGGDTQVRKTFRRLNTFLRAEGTVTINISVSYDWGDVGTAKPVSYVEDVNGAPITYDGAGIEYDASLVIYGGDNGPVLHTNIEGSAYSVRTTFVSYQISAPHTIQGFVYDISPRGRK